MKSPAATVPDTAGSRILLFRVARYPLPPAAWAGYSEGMEPTSLTLLGRARQGDQTAWQRVVAIYQPFIAGWLRRRGIHPQDAEDLSYDVLAVLVRKLPEFEHAGRPGSFRTWLRTVAGNRVKKFFAAANRRGTTGEAAGEALAQLADDNSDLAMLWDQEHDEHVFRRLLELIEDEFEPRTLHVFRRLVIDEEKAADVSRETGLSLAAVYAAKSRVLARLRAEMKPFVE